MKLLTLLLAVSLIISVVLNVVLLSQPASPTDNAPSESISRLFSPQNNNELLLSREQHNSNTNRLDVHQDKQRVIENIELMITNRQYSLAAEKINVFLKHSPRDVDFLYLETRLMIANNSINSALLQLYDLLDFPLTTEQQSKIRSTIELLSDKNITTLRTVKSWDLLSAFLEPLWQIAPNNRHYVVNLAEAYARQNLEAPMENILASMLPDDPEANRIRQILNQLRQNPTPKLDSLLPSKNDDLQPVPLSRNGDHFIVASRVNNKDVNLLIDTGASTTVLSEGVFNRLINSTDHEFLGFYKVNTAAGTIEAPLYQMAQVSIQHNAVKNIAVIVLPLDDFGEADGLLGMNFLREFDFKIDQQSNSLLLLRR